MRLDACISDSEKSYNATLCYLASDNFFSGIRAAGGGGWRQTVFLFGVVRLDAALFLLLFTSEKY